VVQLVILSFGSNVGNGVANISKAYEMLGQTAGEILKTSSFYKSPPWGFDADQDFINSVVFMQTSYPAEKLLKELKLIEVELGRKNKTKEEYESRIIDIDIIDFSGEVISQQALEVPHPLMTERAFVLGPLTEILPFWTHPKLGVKSSELLKELSDWQNIVKMR
jgi:2-amino-4-hydroxy-6-hydroxymethyldihydropteridine diphosphokinase